MDAVRRFFAFGLAWLAAAVVATVVAWQGVGLIGDQVTGDSPSTLSASEIEEKLASTTTEEAPSSSSAPRRSTRTGAGGDPAGTTRPTTAPGQGTTTQPTTAPGQGSTAPPTTDPTVPPPTAPAVSKTYTMTGGTVRLRFSPQGVTVVFATPKPGFQVTKNEPGDDNGWRVEFEGEGGRSRIDGWWDNGPQVRIDDDGASGGGDGPRIATADDGPGPGG
jgi:hypothetical protein